MLHHPVTPAVKPTHKLNNKHHISALSLATTKTITTTITSSATITSAQHNTSTMRLLVLAKFYVCVEAFPTHFTFELSQVSVLFQVVVEGLPHFIALSTLLTAVFNSMRLDVTVVSTILLYICLSTHLAFSFLLSHV